MTATDLKRQLAQTLEANGVEAADFESRQIIEFVLGRPIVLCDNITVTDEQQNAINEICTRRIKKEPPQGVAY